MSLARDVTTVGAATLTSRLLGFLRDAGIAAILGAGVLSDAYFAALQIPNLFRRLLAEGALNSAFVPMWIRIREESGPEGTSRFGEQVLGAMTRALGLVAVLCLLGAPVVVHLIAPGFASEGERFPLAVTFVRLSVPYVALSGIVAVAASALNAQGRVAAAAFGLVVFNGVLVAAVVALLLLGTEATPAAAAMLSAAMVAAGAAQLLCVGAAWMRTDERPRRLAFGSSPAVRRFLVQAIPGVVAGGVPQLKLMAGAMVASSSQAAVSWLYYANRLYELPLGVISIAISSVMVPAIAQACAAATAPTVRPRNRVRSSSRWRCRCPPRRLSPCCPRRLPAACSSAARSGRATPPWWRGRWPRSRPACRATRWKRCSARCRSPMRTRARPCTRRCAASPPR